MDVVVAGTAEDKGLAPFPGHEGRPRWLARPGLAELGEFGDVVDFHRGAVIAQLAPRLERAWDAWQAERYQRGEISQRPGYADNPFRPR